ncbi:class I SAM-dependent methyltransferase [Geomonas ferrireducens]|uniref:class I SAM-dependent methyltransferase n=1 Tax=Geomonas ferrireducens TaxID=2570227 RepID=UPI0010A93C6B|nr:class I SAM-dependent methyltransferase [Geomonas ferrireducens]
MNCRFCDAQLTQVFLDLGFAPPSNDYLAPADLQSPERYFPLRLFICDSCFLVQTEDYSKADELFRHDYAYFSSVSSSWLEHAGRYATMITERLRLDGSSFVMEIASNDGYLLKNFVNAGIPCLGIEPTAGTAEAARVLGVPVLQEFFGEALAASLASEGRKADLIIGNNVFAHVPQLNDFAAGLKIALKERGVVTLEFPHLMQLIDNNQFDTVYHEHYSYFSFHCAQQILARQGLTVFDVEELPTHGGSLRVYARHAEDDSRPIAPRVDELKRKERAAGMLDLGYYSRFQQRAERVKDELLGFLLARKAEGKTVAAYGAAAKGNTLLNFCGIKKDLIPFVVDASPYKQGKLLPGSHIPVVSEEVLRVARPDYLLILPWNIKVEIVQQLEYARQWGTRFLVAIPSLEFCEAGR